MKRRFCADKTLPVNDGLDIINRLRKAWPSRGKDVVHRDIKPSNIMITEDEDHAIAKVTDFGIARMSSSSVKTMTGIVLGSPRYMSPDKCWARKWGRRRTSFSLGVVLFETLTGSAPFDSPSINSIMYQTVRALPAGLDIECRTAAGARPHRRQGNGQVA